MFSIIPALKNAEFLRYGVMHRNTFINAPKAINIDYSFKSRPNVFIAGQLSGVEGYVESAGTGLLAAIYLERKLSGKPQVLISENTILGALSKYITTETKDFQPMNANFGILTPITVRDKKERKRLMAERSLAAVQQFKSEIS